MRASVRTFMTRIIDYAGLFPPAELEMAEAVRRFLEHRRGPHGWMLARFVCPAARLHELVPLLDRLGTTEAAVGLAVLGRGGDTPESFLSGLEADLEEVARAIDHTGARITVDQLEARLPQGLSHQRLADTLERAAELLRSLEPTPAPFFEASLVGDWRGQVADGVRAVAAAHTEVLPMGLKIRCGGVAAAAVPGAAAVTAAIAACSRAGVPLKATQGLHHPVRHFDRRLESMAHGFLNLFTAGMLAHARGLDEGRLLEVVEDEDPGSFSFGETGLAWRGEPLSELQIAKARRAAVTSFGSCSFAEPRDDLAGMGLLDDPP